MKVITKIYRGSVVESFHLGYAYVTDETGKELLSAGNPDTPVFTQETAAIFKLVALLQEKGDEKFKLTDKEMAVACSTHSGKEVQTDVIHSLLKKIDVKINELQCEIETPEPVTFEKLIIQGRRPSQIHNRYSGLHAGVLALAKTLGEDAEDYLKAISHTHTKYLEVIKKYSGFDKILKETDDSGLESYFLPMNKITIMYNALLKGTDENLTKVFQVVTDFPEMIAGEGKFDTEFIKLMKGNGLVKSGSHGLVALCVKPPKENGVNIVVKSIDGSTEAAVSMAIEIMNHLNIIDKKNLEKLKEFHSPEYVDALGNKTGHLETEIIDE
jgi:L-asparaginase II